MSTLENGFSGVRCPECETYLEQDGKWLYCLQCGWDEEEEKQEEEELD
jgi:exosome complex RNA-binding protein Csl4